MSWGHRTLPFPQNLCQSQRRYVEAVHEHGSIAGAAVALRVAEGTVKNGLKKARLRAGVTTTDALVERYLATQEAS